MTIVVFLIDSSASMAQKTYQGTSMLDVARSVVEMILKVIPFSRLFSLFSYTFLILAITKKSLLDSRKLRTILQQISWDSEDRVSIYHSVRKI